MQKVLLLDDEPWALNGLKNSIHWADFNCSIIGACTNPLEGLQRIYQEQPDLVFTDVRMPELSGLDLIKRCRDQKIASNFVIISGYADFAFAKQALEYGVSHYLLKPIDLDELKTLLQKLCIEAKKLSKDGANEQMRPDSFTKIINYLDEHYAERDISLSDLSKRFNIHSTYICDLFKKNKDKTFTAYLTDLRLQKACHLLRTTNLPIYMVAEESGYDTYYFTTLFKKKLGKPPLLYRKEGCNG